MTKKENNSKPEQVEDSYHKLSIQVGLNGLSFCILDTIGKKLALSHALRFNEELSPYELQRELKESLRSGGVLEYSFSEVITIHRNTLYGLVPQTLCGPSVAGLCIDRTGRVDIVGDEDALDICVLSEKRVPRGDILLEALPIGGVRVIDGNEADDKIIAVLKNDAVFGLWRDIDDCPEAVIERLRHYFMTYKHAPGSEEETCEVVGVYDRQEAYEVIRRAQIDYDARFADVKALLDTMMVKYS